MNISFALTSICFSNSSSATSAAAATTSMDAIYMYSSGFDELSGGLSPSVYMAIDRDCFWLHVVTQR